MHIFIMITAYYSIFFFYSIFFPEQFWQFYNAYSLYNISSHPDCNEWMVRMKYKFFFFNQSMYQLINLSIYISIYLSVCLSVCLSVMAVYYQCYMQVLFLSNFPLKWTFKTFRINSHVKLQNTCKCS